MDIYQPGPADVGAANLPTAPYAYARYNPLTGMRTDPHPEHPLSRPQAAVVERLPDSRAAKLGVYAGDRGIESRPMAAPDLTAAIAATGITPDASVLTIHRPKLAARGYVDPALIALRRGIHGTDFASEVMELKP